MNFQIDKRIANDWLRHLNEANEIYVREIALNPSVDVAVFVGRASLNFLKALTELAQDKETATHIAEYAAHGMAHALVQFLLWTKPPTFDPPTETVN